MIGICLINQVLIDFGPTYPITALISSELENAGDAEKELGSWDRGLCDVCDSDSDSDSDCDYE